MSDRSGLALSIAVDAVAELLSGLTRRDHPGLAIGIAHEGKILFEGAAGLADLKSRRPLTVESGMAIGSTTKHMASLAFLLLCERGRASVNDALGVYLPEMPKHVRDITIGMLMGHLSGLRDIAELSMLFDGLERRVELATLLRTYSEIASVDSSPGERWSYNNGGYLLLSAVLERAWDAPLEDILKNQLFTPAGLEGSYLQRFDDDAPPSRARLYSPSGSSFVETCRSIEGLGQGGVTCSLRDLMRWLRQFADPCVGTPQSWMYLTRPMRLRNGVATDYGAGLRLGRYRGLRILHHPGAVPGANAQMLRAPGLDLDVVVLANRQDLSAIDIANRILSLCVSGLKSPPAPATLRPSGLFRSVRSGRSLRFCEDHIVLDSVPLPVVSDAKGSFRPIAGGMMRRERIFHDARADRVTISHLGKIERLSSVKVGAVKLPACTLWRQGPLALTGQSGGLRATGPVGHADYDLAPLGGGYWEARAQGAMPLGFILAIRADGSLTLSNPRVRSLPLRASREKMVTGLSHERCGTKGSSRSDDRRQLGDA